MVYLNEKHYLIFNLYFIVSQSDRFNTTFFSIESV